LVQIDGKGGELPHAHRIAARRDGDSEFSGDTSDGEFASNIF
jgi:hypothetical protein